LSVGIEENLFFLFSDAREMKLLRDALFRAKKFRAFGFEGERIIALDV